MDRAIPCSNQYLDEKWSKEYLKKHHEKLASVLRGSNTGNEKMKKVDIKNYIPTKSESDSYNNILIQRKRKFGPPPSENHKKEKIHEENIKILRRISNIIETPGVYSMERNIPPITSKYKDSHKKAEVVSKFVTLKKTITEYDNAKQNNITAFSHFCPSSLEDEKLFVINSNNVASKCSGNIKTSTMSAPETSDYLGEITMATECLDSINELINKAHYDKQFDPTASQYSPVGSLVSINSDNSEKKNEKEILFPSLKRSTAMAMSNNNVVELITSNDKVANISNNNKLFLSTGSIISNASNIENKKRFDETITLLSTHNFLDEETEREAKHELNNLKKTAYNEKNFADSIAKEDILAPGVGFKLRQRSKSIMDNKNKEKIKSDYSRAKLIDEYKDSRKALTLRCTKPIVIGDKKMTLEVMAKKYQGHDGRRSNSTGGLRFQQYHQENIDYYMPDITSNNYNNNDANNNDDAERKKKVKTDRSLITTSDMLESKVKSNNLDSEIIVEEQLFFKERDLVPLQKVNLKNEKMKLENLKQITKSKDNNR